MWKYSIKNGLMLHPVNGRNMKHQNQFGKAFRRIRRARGLTQEDFANESGRTYIGEIERGLKHPTLQKIDDLANSLSLHPLTMVALSYLAKEDAIVLDLLLERVKQEAQEILHLERKQE